MYTASPIIRAPSMGAPILFYRQDTDKNKRPSSGSWQDIEHVFIMEHATGKWLLTQK